MATYQVYQVRCSCGFESDNRTRQSATKWKSYHLYQVTPKGSRPNESGHAVTVVKVDVPTIETCKWFAKCEQPATGTTTHPVLGDVLTCDRCHAFATGQSR